MIVYSDWRRQYWQSTDLEPETMHLLCHFLEKTCGRILRGDGYAYFGNQSTSFLDRIPIKCTADSHC